MDNETFLKIKEQAIELCSQKSACASETKRVIKSNSFAELCTVIKDNFNWCANNKILTAEIIEQHKDDFAENKIFCNVSISKGFLLASDSATVRAYGSATVRAYGSATVSASGSATVEAYGSATVRAYGSATVRAYGSATVSAYDSATVEAYDSATVRAYGSATVRAYDSATVSAYDSAYIQCRTTIECKITDNVIVRRTDTNTIEHRGMNVKQVNI